MIDQNYIWYAGYGSNLSRQRFLCYILGGKPKYGNKKHSGCKNRTLPTENKPIKIPYILYFALPSGEKTSNWGKGGVAFIAPEKIEDEKLWTLGRMWKITKDQYYEIKEQEGTSWYNYELYLGEDGNIPIYTITNKNKCVIFYHHPRDI
ncbi:MAG: hypothetical protein QXI49_06735 [Candidatus Methanomethylicaceae archaeon]